MTDTKIPASGTQLHYSHLELFCPRVECGDPVPMSAFVPGMTPFFGAAAIDPGKFPRTRRRMMYLGANVFGTRFRYMCPVCSFIRVFLRNWLSSEIIEVAAPLPAAPDTDGTT